MRHKGSRRRALAIHPQRGRRGAAARTPGPGFAAGTSLGSSPTLATITYPLASHIDPSAVVCASRRTGEPWFCFEQPDRGGAALAGLGQVALLGGLRSRRFSTVADRWRSLSARAVADSPGELGGGGPVAVGGFALRSRRWLLTGLERLRAGVAGGSRGRDCA